MRVNAMQADTLDALCDRHLGRTGGVVEQTLERNPGLARHGAVLPHGVAVDLPTYSAAAPARRVIVQLWD